MYKQRIFLPVIFLITYIIIPIKVVQLVAIFVISLFFISFLISKYLYIKPDADFLQNSYNCKNREEENVQVEVKNYGLLPIKNFLINIYSNGCFEGDSGNFLCSLHNKEVKVLECKIITTDRGVHNVGPVVITASDPFNLFPFRKIINIKAKVIVYPKYSDLNLLLLSGEKGGNQKIDNIIYENLNNLKSIRDYRQGDPVKRINWKATAKANTPQVMEFSNNLTTPLFIIMDIDPQNYPLKQRYYHIERTIELATSLVVAYSQRGNSSSVITRDSKGPILVNGNLEILEIFSAIEIGSNEPSSRTIMDDYIESRVNLPPGAHLYILVGKIDGDIINKTSIFKKNQIDVTLVETGGVSESKLSIPNINIKYITPYGDKYLNA